MLHYTTTALNLGHLLFLVGGLAAILLRHHPRISRTTSILTAAIGSLMWMIAAWLGLREPVHDTLFRIGFDWVWAWQLDNLSSFFLLVVATAGLLCSIYGYQYAREYDHHGGAILGWAYNWFLLSLGLVLTANNVLAFLLAWEFMSVSSLFMVGLDHTRPAVRKAAFIYGVITHGATALLMIAFLTLSNLAGSDFNNWQALRPVGTLYHVVFALFLIGFGSKAGLVPLHVWLPRAHPAAPSHVSALMSGVMVKVAIYGLIRVAFVWLAAPAPAWGFVLLVLGLVSALTGALYAMIDQDMKGVLAYSTIENVGLLVTGMGAALLLGREHAATYALAFVLLHVVSHAAFKILLFLGAGAVQGTTHTRRLDRLGGLIHYMPKTSLLVLVGVLTIAAVPPLAGFASEWTLMQALFQLTTTAVSTTTRLTGVLSMAAVALTAGLVAAAMVRMFGVIFLGRPRTADGTHAHEPGLAMRVPMAILSLLCLGIGLTVQPLLGFTSKLAANLLLAQATPDAVTSNVAASLAAAQSAAPHPAPLAAAAQAASASASTSAPALLLVGLALAVVAVIMLITVNLLTRHYGKKATPTRRSIPWGCGIDLTPAMQYTGLGLAEPARAMFAPLVHIKGVIAKAKGANIGHYSLNVPVPGESLFYKPVRNLLVKVAERVRLVQAGSLQLYLAYLFATLVVLLLIAR